jgi:hypothetical protein
MLRQPAPALTVDLTIDSSVLNTLTFGGSNTPGSVVLIALTVMPAGPGPAQNLTIVYTTTAADSPSTIATAAANQINALLSNVSASASGPKVRIDWKSGFLGFTTKDNILGPRGTDPEAQLQANFDGTNIAFAGQVAGDYYGVYTDVNPGVDEPTFGCFTPLVKGQSLDAVASAVAQSINDLPTLGVIATAIGPKVTIIGGSRITACDVSSDTRIGQPGRCYCSGCSWCCGQQLGRVTEARLDLDTAVVQLRAGGAYKAEILDVGVVNGSYAITPGDVLSEFNVTKSGITTGVTTGVVNAFEVNGFADAPRFYTGAMSILGPLDPTDPAKKRRLPFADHGDSGSAVVRTLTNSAGNAACEVVGILFAADPPPTALAFMTPITPILDSFKLVIETATVPGDVRTVSPGAGVSAAAQPVAAKDAVFPVSGESRLEHRVLEAQKEILATTAGQRAASLVRQHFSEAQVLFNGNRRIAAVWHRNGGPQIVQALAKAVEFHHQPIPKEIDGRPVLQSLRRIKNVMSRYASKDLASDLDEIMPPIERLVGLTYPQLIDALRSIEKEQ